MRRIALLVVGLAGLIVWWTFPALAEKRVALVIGNSAYEHTVGLKNPRQDAKAITAALIKLGFEVIEGVDLKQAEFLAKVNKFATQIETADVGLLFYAGHGLQAGGKNYLVPVDANLRTEIDLQFQTMPLNLILKSMEAAKRVNIVLLDACRNNPLASKLASANNASRSVGSTRGLARVGNVVGTYIAFSTSPDSVAQDGSGDHSPFAQAILKEIATPGQDIEIVMRRVRADVITETDGRQVPWSNSSLTSGFVFAPSANGDNNDIPPQATPNVRRTSPSIDQKAEEERLYWDSVRNSNDAQLLQSYVKRYPQGAYVEIARLTIQRLDREAQQKQSETGADVANAQPQTPPQSPEFRLYRDYDSFGFDLQRVNGISLDGCVARCRQAGECHAFTYNDHYNVCFLKSGSNGLIPNSNAIAGLFGITAPKRTLTGFDNIDAPGNDYSSLKRADLMTCYDICESDSACRGFSYVYKNKSCWFKSLIGSTHKKTGISLFVR